MGTEIQQNRYDQLLRRVGGLIGSGSKVSEVLSELFPVLDVENVPGELLRLMGTRIGFGGGFVDGVAAESPSGQVFNPANSGLLVTVTSMTFSSDSTALWRFGVDNQPLATHLQTQIFRDTRDLAPPIPTVQIRRDSRVALASGTNQLRVLANTSYTISDPNGVCVLAPGTGLVVGPSGVNVELAFHFLWRSRVAELSELRL